MKIEFKFQDPTPALIGDAAPRQTRCRRSKQVAEGSQVQASDITINCLVAGAGSAHASRERLPSGGRTAIRSSIWRDRGSRRSHAHQTQPPSGGTRLPRKNPCRNTGRFPASERTIPTNFAAAKGRTLIRGVGPRMPAEGAQRVTIQQQPVVE